MGTGPTLLLAMPQMLLLIQPVTQQARLPMACKTLRLRVQIWLAQLLTLLVTQQTQ